MGYARRPAERAFPFRTTPFSENPMILHQAGRPMRRERPFREVQPPLPCPRRVLSLESNLGSRHRTDSRFTL
jgi:hypothetical protein